LFAAHLLRAIGWEVAVFERSVEDLADRGAGLGTHDALYAVMRRIGLNLDESMAVVTRSYMCLDRSGNMIREVPLERLMSAWVRFYRPLRDALPAPCYHAGRQLEHVDQHHDSVTAIFSDGSRARGDLLVGADGVRSTVRGQFFPDVKPVYVGYVAWRALVFAAQIRPPTREFFRERYVFCLPAGELALAYPVPTRDADARTGPHAYNLVWYRPAGPELLAMLLTDRTGQRHDVAIPPPLIRQEVVADAKACARALLAPPIAELMTQAAQPFFQPIYEVISPKLVFGRVALLGDAAFVARPHVGAGVTKAALDAAGLANAISQADGALGTALARYDRERRRFGDFVVARSRTFGAYIRPEDPHDGGADLAQPAEVVMGDYIAATEDLRAATLDGALHDE
jgi:2-polyprenyl-6-methoxyphenol hydroxylase-like FAD-dependent oxidoreductase